jgi:hypothetical protein
MTELSGLGDDAFCFFSKSVTGSDQATIYVLKGERWAFITAFKVGGCDAAVRKVADLAVARL